MKRAWFLIGILALGGCGAPALMPARMAAPSVVKIAAPVAQAARENRTARVIVRGLTPRNVITKKPVLRVVLAHQATALTQATVRIAVARHAATGADAAQQRDGLVIARQAKEIAQLRTSAVAGVAHLALLVGAISLAVSVGMFFSAATRFLAIPGIACGVVLLAVGLALPTLGAVVSAVVPWACGAVGVGLAGWLGWEIYRRETAVKAAAAGKISKVVKKIVPGYVPGGVA